MDERSGLLHLHAVLEVGLADYITVLIPLCPQPVFLAVLEGAFHTLLPVLMPHAPQPVQLAVHEVGFYFLLPVLDTTQSLARVGRRP